MASAEQTGCSACKEASTAGEGRRFGLGIRELWLPAVVGGLMLIYATGWVRTILSINAALIAACIGGVPIVIGAIRGLFQKNLNVGGLVSIALIATLIVGEYLAGAIVVFIMQIGELLENLTVARTGNAIRKLMDLKPKTARVRSNGEEAIVPIEAVTPGDRVLVKPGERIPVDGVVLSGQASVNQAALTGESVPIEATDGTAVYEGTVIELGALEIETTQAGEGTTLANIIRLVEQAQAEKPPTQRVADRFAKWFTPAILVLCGITYGITQDVIRAVTMLVVACPCALVLATPTAVIASIGNAARQGILVKGGLALEAAARVKAVVLDKTGTLTRGQPEIVAIQCFGSHSEADVVRFAAIAEKFSEHPLAQAVVRHASHLEIDVPDPSTFDVIPGRGVVASVADTTLVLGNREHLADHNVDLSDDARAYVSTREAQGESCLLLAVGGELAGVLSVADQMRPGAADVISELKQFGIEKTLMLTGDNPSTAHVIASRAGIDEFSAEQLPQDKAETVKGLRKERSVAVVGDGINDAPALAAADVGIAMGAIGSDVAIEAADIALLGDSLEQIPTILRLGSRMVRTIKLNIFGFAVGFNLVAMLVAGLGLVGPVMGAVLHNVGSVFVVANSALLLRRR